MSIKLMSLIWEDHTGELTGIEKTVLIKMADHAADNGTQIFPSVRRISLDTGFCETAIKDAIKGLVAKKRISKTVRSKKLHHITNLYRIHVAVLEEAANRKKQSKVDKPVDNAGITEGVGRQTTGGLGARRPRGGSPDDRNPPSESSLKIIPIETQQICSKNEQQELQSEKEERLRKKQIVHDMKKMIKNMKM